MRRLITIIGLECYALLLAALQYSVGVRTDEAKYLLDIPYPHPPLARFLLSLLDGWEYQELFWHIVFATLLIQAVWLVVDLVKRSSRAFTVVAMLCWLLSTAVILQAGTVMMAPLTALQMLVFVWLFLREEDSRGFGPLIALFWLASLFTAYQSILFFPLVFAVLARTGLSRSARLIVIGVPVLLLALYTLTNPLALASMVSLSGSDVHPLLMDRFLSVLRLWAIGGGITLSIAGTIGLFLRRSTPLLFSFLLLLAYLFLSAPDYYTILFTPLLAGGLVLLLQKTPVALWAGALMPVGMVVSLLFVSVPSASVAQAVYQTIGNRGGGDVVLIAGSFGHEWQYYATVPVLRYQSDRLDSARAVVCLAPCSDMSLQTGWERVESTPVEVWVRR